MTYKDRFFVEMSYRYVFEGDIDKYWVDASSFNLGIGVFLSKKKCLVVKGLANDNLGHIVRRTCVS